MPRGDLFPEIGPFETGYLPLSDGHVMYWEQVGHPHGRPALFLHGGPGAGAGAVHRRFFDPQFWRVAIFDQRGAGRSRPLGALSANTTAHLVADIEALRLLLGIERWTAILGVSWGTTLGLAYAQAHTQRIGALVLGFVTTTSRREVEWLTEGVGRIFPQEWERFAAAVPERLRHLPLVDAYATLLADPDPAVQEHAAREWCAWEDAHVSLAPGHQPSPRYNDPKFRLRFARLVTHYWRHAAFLDEAQLLRDAATLNGIPGVLIHGRYDVSSPLETAWRLNKRWDTSALHIFDDAGHGGGDTFMPTVIGALNRFAAQ